MQGGDRGQSWRAPLGGPGVSGTSVVHYELIRRGRGGVCSCVCVCPWMSSEGEERQHPRVVSVFA